LPRHETPEAVVKSHRGVFVVLSLALHLTLFLAMGAWLAPPPLIDLDLPEEIELGVMDGDPGEAGEPPPAAPPTPEPEKVVPKEKPKPKVKPEPEMAASDFSVDASVPTEAENVAAEDDPEGATEVAAAGAATGDDGALPSDVTGDGLAPLGLGGGMGFGAGGFGTGLGGPAGAVIGLNVDLKRIRDSSLILEVSALLELIPEWLQLLDGSGLDALNDFDRIFVASPSLKRSSLVVSGRVRGGQAAITGAVNALARGAGKSAAFKPEGELRVARWHNRGPTERVLGATGKDQIVIARPGDVSRALAVAAALGVRHAKHKQMERLPGALALLAMYEGEAAALSIEGVAQYIRGDKKHAPPGLRLSLRPLDQHHAELRAYGYYKTAAAAEAALPVLEELRTHWIGHPQAQYLGLIAALEEAKLGRDGKTLTVEATITMHQVRYLLGFVSRALKPRD
jgi:hypothetical protein